MKFFMQPKGFFYLMILEADNQNKTNHGTRKRAYKLLKKVVAGISSVPFCLQSVGPLERCDICFHSKYCNKKKCIFVFLAARDFNSYLGQQKLGAAEMTGGDSMGGELCCTIL